MNEVDVLLMGAIPMLPVILCKDEKTQLVVNYNLHEDWARKPATHIPDEWPDEWEANAVVMTPLKVIGTKKMTSFAIKGEISDRARKLLDAYIMICRVKAGPHVAYRELTKATNMDRREITALIKELVEAGIGTYKYSKGFSLDIGTWRPDAAKAKQANLEIREF